MRTRNESGFLRSDPIFKRLYRYVQLPAKTACLLPFLLSLFYAIASYRHFSPRNTVIFFISMLSFDLSVTGLNNYVDSKKSAEPLPFSRRTSLRILIVLWAVAGVTAVLLVCYAGLIVLACGAACFLIGIFYTWGPAPISHMPLGEAFSGVFEGFFIPFLTVYLNAPERSLVFYSFQNGTLGLSFHLPGLFRLALLCVPAMAGVANIMLANNICDLEEDVRVGRFTLPYYLGRETALRLFALLYLAAFAAVAAVASLRVLPPYCLVTLAAGFFVLRNVRIFRKEQSKAKTFPLSVRNLLLILCPLILSAAAACLP